MAQLNIEREFSVDVVKKVEIRNTNGRIDAIGWNRPLVRLEIQIEVPGEAVPDDAQPQIQIDEETLQVKAGFFAGPGHFNIDDFVDEVGKIGDKVQHIISGIFGKDASEKTKKSENQPEEKSFDEDSEIHLNFKFPTGSRPDVRTHIRVMLPESLALKVKCMNGPVSIQKIQSDMKAQTTNGPIRVEGSYGHLVLKTMNGPIHVEDSAPSELVAKSMNGPIRASLTSLRGDVSLKSLNGPVRLSIPSTASALLHAKSTSGPVKVSTLFNADKKSIRVFDGMLGSGDHIITLKTVAGPVTVLTDETELAPTPPVPPQPPVPPLPTLPSTPSVPAASSAVDPIQPVIPSGTDAEENPEILIDKMLQNGKITQAEADKLRSVLKR